MSDQVGNPEDRFSHNEAQTLKAYLMPVFRREETSQSSVFPTRSDGNGLEQQQRLASGILTNNKDTGQIGRMFSARLCRLRMTKVGFSPDGAHIL